MVLMREWSWRFLLVFPIFEMRKKSKKANGVTMLILQLRDFNMSSSILQTVRGSNTKLAPSICRSSRDGTAGSSSLADKDRHATDNSCIGHPLGSCMHGF